jgi:hypothetical protein
MGNLFFEYSLGNAKKISKFLISEKVNSVHFELDYAEEDE